MRIYLSIPFGNYLYLLNFLKISIRIIIRQYKIPTTHVMRHTSPHVSNHDSHNT